MTRGEVVSTADGWIYGVRFGDGSVSSRWSGSTQRERAVEEIEAIHARAIAFRGEELRPVDLCVLVRRRAGGSWEVAE
jgi:hypothetical protein